MASWKRRRRRHGDVERPPDSDSDGDSDGSGGSSSDDVEAARSRRRRQRRGGDWCPWCVCTVFSTHQPRVDRRRHLGRLKHRHDMQRRRGSSGGSSGNPKQSRRGRAYNSRACQRGAAAALFLVAALAVCAWVDRPSRPLPISTPVQLTPASRALLRSQRYFIAINAHNSAAKLRSGVPHLLRLVKALGPSRCYVSVYENGSLDRTGYFLAVLARHLRQLGAQASVVTESWKPWWRLCAEAHVECDVEECEAWCPSPDVAAAQRLRADMRKRYRGMDAGALDDDADLYNVCGQLHTCQPQLRVPVMAAVRNRALSMLEGFVSANDGDNVRVVFIDDVYFTAESIVELLLTNGMNYDATCGLDFSGTSFHDLATARDAQGQRFFPHFPHVAEPLSAVAVRAGHPFRVYSCWNGVVVLPGNAIVEAGLRFRSPRHAEVTTPDARREAVAWSPRYNASTCTGTETQLLFKDLWRAGFTRVWVNPAVHFHHDVWTHYVQRWVLSWVNALWWRTRELQGDPSHARYALTNEHLFGNLANPLPLAVACTTS